MNEHLKINNRIELCLIITIIYVCVFVCVYNHILLSVSPNVFLQKKECGKGKRYFS
jgi:hypothetical protein